jgi:hypothetical protein
MSHSLIKLFTAQVPYLDGQSTSQTPEHFDANPGIGEVPDTTGADHDSTALIGLRFDWKSLNKPIATKAGVVDIERRLVNRVFGSKLDPAISRDAMQVCERFEKA